MSETPRIINPDLSSNVPSPEQVLQRVREAGISDEAISKIAIIVDNKYRLTTRGSHWPARIAKKKFSQHKPEGPVVSIGTALRGKPRTAEEMDRTLAHELIHVSQELNPNSRKISQGWALRLGTVATGAVLGYYAGGIAGAVGGAFVGDRAGYTYGPHEIEARKLSKLASQESSVATTPAVDDPVASSTASLIKQT